MVNTIYSNENRELIDIAADERSKKTISQCNIAEMDKMIVENKKTGKTTIVNPRKIAALSKQFLDMMRTNNETKWLAPFIAKNIIWTTECKTFFTDGIRIAANPYFAAVLISQGQADLRKQHDELYAKFSDYNDAVEAEREIMSKYFQYVIVHEAYHMIYQHIRRSLLKIGKGSKYEHEVANIAMDMEINRDIEAQYKKYSGATKILEGVWYEDYINKHTGKPFAKEIWEVIYDYLMENPDQLPDENNQQIQEGNLPPFQPPKWPYKDGWDKAIDAIKTNKIKL